MEFNGYLRDDGSVGIRNIIVVVYLVECAHHVARRIVSRHAADNKAGQVQLIGFPGCYPNDYALQLMQRLCTHVNVGAALIVSLGCEGFNREALASAVQDSGRPVETLVIQANGGTSRSVESGAAIVGDMLAVLDECPRQLIGIDKLVVGTICGGSDGTSGVSANPAVGRCFDRLIDRGASCIFEETGELIGCEHIMAERAVTAELGDEIVQCVDKARRYYETMGYGSFAPGNAEGGLTTQEEKSLGAYSKSGQALIRGLLKPGDQPPSGGLYLLDVVPDGEPRFGFPNISDNAEIIELIACGAMIILFTTGRGSVVGSAISPVIKVCANPQTYRNLADDMDINAGKIIEGNATVDAVGEEIFTAVCEVAGGRPSYSEAMGHQEFLMTYKYFKPLGPSCLPK